MNLFIDALFIGGGMLIGYGFGVAQSMREETVEAEIAWRAYWRGYDRGRQDRLELRA